MNVLHIDSSVLGDHSVTRELTAAIVADLNKTLPNLTVTHRDLDKDSIPHLTGASLAKADAAEAAAAEQTLQQFIDADIVVIGAPMYNFSIPSTLKAWVDRVLVAGRTFSYSETGPKGLLSGKKIVIASGRGSAFGEDNPADFQEKYLKQVFAFVGLTDVQFVRAEGIAYSPQHRIDALAAAHATIASLAKAS
ncbi:MAG: NAD(P)H-dependent oxidoreductase [Candidatus Saccharibacteria bacterium]|nr:NAD(P)H-dependent oxidoreductase [Moraxellaceae bacterium]